MVPRMEPVDGLQGAELAGLEQAEQLSAGVGELEVVHDREDEAVALARRESSAARDAGKTKGFSERQCHPRSRAASTKSPCAHGGVPTVRHVASAVHGSSSDVPAFGSPNLARSSSARSP